MTIPLRGFQLEQVSDIKRWLGSWEFPHFHSKWIKYQVTLLWKYSTMILYKWHTWLLNQMGWNRLPSCLLSATKICYCQEGSNANRPRWYVNRLLLSSQLCSLILRIQYCPVIVKVTKHYINKMTSTSRQFMLQIA